MKEIYAQMTTNESCTQKTTYQNLSAVDQGTIVKESYRGKTLYIKNKHFLQCDNISSIYFFPLDYFAFDAQIPATYTRD